MFSTRLHSTSNNIVLIEARQTLSDSSDIVNKFLVYFSQNFSTSNTNDHIVAKSESSISLESNTANILSWARRYFWYFLPKAGK